MLTVLLFILSFLLGTQGYTQELAPHSMTQSKPQGPLKSSSKSKSNSKKKKVKPESKLKSQLKTKPSKPKSWQYWALRLTGETERVRQRAIKKLVKVQDLRSKLLRGLASKDQSLALDVWVALDLPGGFETILENISLDTHGQMFLTLNSLARSKEQVEKLSELYFGSLLKQNQTSPIVRVISLDTLARMGRRLPQELMDDLMSAQLPEVSMAMLDYVRLMLKKDLNGNLGLMQPILLRALEQENEQLKIRAFFISKEFKLIHLSSKVDCSTATDALRRACDWSFE